MAYSDNEHLHPYGSSLLYSTDGVTYVYVNDLASFEGPQGERNESDNTTLSSPNAILLATPGWIKAGEIPFGTYFHKTQMNALQAYFWAGTTLYWRVLFNLLSTESVPSKWETTGWINKFKPFSKLEKGNDDKVMVEWSIKILTKPAFTAGS